MSKELNLINIPKRMKAIGFVKSRKSDDKIHTLCQEMRQVGLSRQIDLQEFVVDGSAGVDIDRDQIDKLMERVGKEDFDCIAVMSITEFTTDMDDLIKFCLRIHSLGCKLYWCGIDQFLSFDLE